MDTVELVEHRTAGTDAKADHGRHGAEYVVSAVLTAAANASATGADGTDATGAGQSSAAYDGARDTDGGGWDAARDATTDATANAIGGDRCR